MSDAVTTAWERDRHDVGRAVHEAWMAEKQRQGFADHPYKLCSGFAAQYDPYCETCAEQGDAYRYPQPKHHPDMVPYDDLTPENQAYDYASGEVAYRLGFTAGTWTNMLDEAKR
jgi:hypothetical protein